MRIRGMRLVVALAVLGVGGSAGAGDYHSGDDMFCSDCHTMHYSQAHDYDGSGTTYLGPGGPFEYLLRDESNNLCLQCHDGVATIPDVLAASANVGVVRQAGALNRDNTPPYLDSDGHTLASTDAPPGNDGSWTPDPVDGLTCVDCHDKHGWGGPTPDPYRNLSPLSGGFLHPSVSYAVGTNNLAMDVFERAAADYDESAVDFNEPDPTNSGYATWCKTCHTDFHGAKGGVEVGGATGEMWLRHPNADADIGAVGGTHSDAGQFVADAVYPKVMTATEDWQPAVAGDVTDHTPSCFTCHKGHGNQNPFGLIYYGTTGPITEEGTADGSYQTACKQCHVQGN
jgi:hypothetical protein